MNLKRWATCALLAATLTAAEGATGNIIKALPHFLDEKGRHTLQPSLFERDAYQAELRQHPERCSGMRFDVQWKARDLKNGNPRLKLEIRASNLPAREAAVFEQTGTPRLFSSWTGLSVTGADFKRLGSVLAWRITLWDGNEQIAEQKSFLW